MSIDTDTHMAHLAVMRRNAGRDDLFTHIHKALRKGLFDVTALAGRVDWTVSEEVDAFQEQWEPLLSVLRSHTRHEDDFLLRPLDGVDAVRAARVDDAHRHLEDLLDGVEASVARAIATRDSFEGLFAYRDLNRFLAEYLPHLHEEETVVMPRIWETRSDEEIAATRGAFMASLTPEESLQSLRLIVAAVDRPTRAAIVARIAASASPEVLRAVLDAAGEAPA